jgi:hypothetical protein
MKLTYRGIEYNYAAPTVEFSTSDTVGKYRGLDVRFRNPKKLVVLQTNLDLKYRNATYKATTVVPAEAVATQPVAVPVAAVSEKAATSVQDWARNLMMQHHRVIKRRQQAMLTRLDAEVGLSARDASHYWNHIQGKIHPSFRATYDRSGAALS